jgi:long-chain acyl-CoA synthetase
MNVQAELRTTPLARNDVDSYSPPWVHFGDFLNLRRDDHSTWLIAIDESTCRRHEYTAAEWVESVTAIAHQLADFGIVPGNTVAVVAHNTGETLAMFFAVWLCGACLVPLDPRDSAERRAEVLLDSAATWVGVDGADERDVLAELHPEVGVFVVDDLPELAAAANAHSRKYDAHPALRQAPLGASALRLYTSGTSGKPKPILLTMRGMLINSDGMREAFGWSKETRALTLLPISHANGLVIGSFLPWFVGGSAVLLDRFHSSTFWSTAASTKATTCSLVPTVLEYLLAEPERSSQRQENSLTEVISGSGPLRAAAALEFEERFAVPVRQLYGLSETSAVVTVTPLRRQGMPETEPRRSIGCAVPHATVSVWLPDGSLCAAGERGEIVVRGGMLMTGYDGRVEETVEAFADGWFHTGDRGYWLPGGDGAPWFYLEGRFSDIIVRGGLGVVPQLIDDVANDHPLVSRAVAFGFANRWYGEEIALMVVPSAPITERELLAWCARRLDFEHCPKVVLFSNELPLTSVGKIRRSVLAASAADHLSGYWDASFRTPPHTLRNNKEN